MRSNPAPLCALPYIARDFALRACRVLILVACGVSRLARYNITAEALSGGSGKVKYFEGTPIATTLLLVMLMFAAASQNALGESLWFGQAVVAGFTLHPMVLLFAVSGSLMVSRMHIPKL